MSTGSINCYASYLIPLPEELNDDSKLEEILWNFSRYYPPERRLTLSQNPHFYDHLPTSSTANWKELYAKATQENWHTYHPEPICVLTNAPSRVFLELCHKAWTFDNVWSANGTLIFKSKCLAFVFFLSSNLTSFQASVGNSRVKAVLSEHPSNTTRGVTWSIWHQGQTKLAPQTIVCW